MVKGRIETGCAREWESASSSNVVDRLHRRTHGAGERATSAEIKSEHSRTGHGRQLREAPRSGRVSLKILDPPETGRVFPATHGEHPFSREQGMARGAGCKTTCTITSLGPSEPYPLVQAPRDQTGAVKVRR